VRMAARGAAQRRSRKRGGIMEGESRRGTQY
jgi:hypothetical protein